MADQSIRREFVEGVHEIFTTLFNNGSEGDDGVFFYALSEKTEENVYGENKYKTYKPPVLLVCKAVVNPQHGEQDVEEVKDTATFTVTYQSLVENGFDLTNAGLSVLRRGMMKFRDAYYKVDLINPRAYVEDVFLLYDFQCTQDPEVTDDDYVIEEPDEEEPPEDIDPDTPPEEPDPDDPGNETDPDEPPPEEGDET